MDEIGVPLYTSYIFLGLSLSIGLLVYILIRDARRRKAEREEAERQRVEALLREAAEQEKARLAEAGESGGASVRGDEDREENKSL